MAKHKASLTVSTTVVDGRTRWEITTEPGRFRAVIVECACSLPPCGCARSLSVFERLEHRRRTCHSGWHAPRIEALVKKLEKLI